MTPQHAETLGTSNVDRDICRSIHEECGIARNGMHASSADKARQVPPHMGCEKRCPPLRPANATKHQGRPAACQLRGRPRRLTSPTHWRTSVVKERVSHVKIAVVLFSELLNDVR